MTHKYSSSPLDLSFQNIGPGQYLNIYEPVSRLMCHLNTSLFQGCNFVTFSLVLNCSHSFGNLGRCVFVSKLTHSLISVCLVNSELCLLLCSRFVHLVYRSVLVCVLSL